MCRQFCFWLLMFTIGWGGLHAKELPPKRILVISTFHLTHRWTAEFNQTLQDSLHVMPQKVSVDFLELNAIQRRNIDFEAKFQPYLKNIQQGDYDLLVAVLGDAVTLLKSNYSRLPPGLPIVCIVDQPVSPEERRRFPTMTGTSNDVDVLKNIDLGLLLMPQTKKVLIITDDVDSGIFLHQSLLRDLRSYRRCPIELINGQDYSTDQVLQKVAKLPRDSFVLFAPWRNFLKDGYFSLEQVAAELKKRSHGPYFIITDVLIGKGALGGYVSKGASHAKLAASQIFQIFSGKKPSELPYIICPRELVVDMDVMRQHRLKAELLPSNAELVNRKAPFGEVYFTECVIIGVAFFFIVLLLFALLFYHLRFRKMSRQNNFLLNHGGALAHVSYFCGDEMGRVIWIGGDAIPGLPNDGAKHVMAEWIVPEERERLRQICDRVVTEAINVDNEIFHSERDGIRRIYRLLVAGKKYADSYLVVIQDITETQAASEAKSYFLTSVSHEIRTPLNAILGFCELLQDEQLSPQERKEYAGAVCSASDRLLELVNDVLDLSRLENGRMQIVLEKTDFSVFIDGILAVFQIQATKKHLALNRHIAPMPLLCIDNGRVRQIIVNLLGNALKFTESGHIDFIAGFQAQTESIGTLTIEIADTGCGISEENLQKIFQPFVRIDAGRDSLAHHGGTGLGVPISQRLAASMNGELAISSTLGAGSRVTIVLKSVRYETACNEPREQLHNVVLPTEITALLVDDIPLNIKVLEAMLKKRNIRTLSAFSGAEALQILEDRPVDVVLTDMWMPEMNGMELAAVLRARSWGKQVKIIAVTADSDVTTNFNMNDFDAILHKPVTFEKLSLALQGKPLA